MGIKYITEEEELKEKYFKSKEELDIIRSDMTLLKWEVLSKAYKLGKKIWPKQFTIRQLAKDMELPYTTVKRCLSLDKANENSWLLLKDGKITAFKLAQICMTKNSIFQDEIVEAVIEDNISTCDIKPFKARGIKDVNKWRHEQAIKSNYARKSAAHMAFDNWMDRGQRMLLLPMDSLPKNKHKSILKKLGVLKRNMERYIEKNQTKHVTFPPPLKRSGLHAPQRL